MHHTIVPFQLLLDSTHFVATKNLGCTPSPPIGTHTYSEAMYSRLAARRIPRPQAGGAIANCKTPLRRIGNHRQLQAALNLRCKSSPSNSTTVMATIDSFVRPSQGRTFSSGASDVQSFIQSTVDSNKVGFHLDRILSPIPLSNHERATLSLFGTLPLLFHFVLTCLVKSGDCIFEILLSFLCPNENALREDW